MDSPATRTDAGPVVLFDGVCNLCHHTVLFIIDRDPVGAIRFASLQSATGAALLREAALPEGFLDCLVLVENGRTPPPSGAARRIARHLRRPWSWLAVFLILPRPLRDAAYRFVAARRYRWFGREDACRIPTPALRARFLA